MLMRLALVLAVGLAPAAMAQECTSEQQVCDQIKSAKRANDAGAPTAALKHLRIAQNSIDIDTQWLVYLLGQKAAAYAQKGNQEQSLAAIASALEFRPNDIWLLLQSCRQHGAADFLAKAQRDCARVRTLLRRMKDPETRAVALPYLVLAEAQLALYMRFPDVALKKIDELDSEAMPARFTDDLRAAALSMTGDHMGASEALDRVLTQAADEPAATRAQLYHRRGFERFAIGAFASGLQDLEIAAKTARQIPSDAPNRDRDLARYLYGLCAVHLRRNDAAAAQHWCGALSETEIANENHIFLDAVGLAQLRNGQYAEAAENFAEALRLFPRSAQSYRHLQQSVTGAQKAGMTLELEDYVDDSVRLLQEGSFR